MTSPAPVEVMTTSDMANKIYDRLFQNPVFTKESEIAIIEQSIREVRWEAFHEAEQIITRDCVNDGCKYCKPLVEAIRAGGEGK